MAAVPEARRQAQRTTGGRRTGSTARLSITVLHVRLAIPARDGAEVSGRQPPSRFERLHEPRMPAMSSASVAVTRPSRSRTAAYARARNAHGKIRGRGDHQRGSRRRFASASRQSSTKRMIAVPMSMRRALHEDRHAVGDELIDCLDVVRQPADDHTGPVCVRRRPSESRWRWVRTRRMREDPRGSASPTQPVRYVSTYVMTQFREADRGRRCRTTMVDADSAAVLDGVVERDLGEIGRPRAQSPSP